MGYTSCCVCKHCFSAGIGSAKTCNFDGYRRFLRPGSRGRRRRLRFCGQIFEYHDNEARLKPQLREDVFVRNAVAFARQRQAPFLGHKGLPMLARWPGFNWYRMNTPDFMHGKYAYMCNSHPLTQFSSLHIDCKVVCEMLVKVMIGKGLGLHEDNDGGYKCWSKDPTHRREAQALGVFRDTWADRDGALPWRLSKEELKLLNKRMQCILWPHYVDRLYYEGCSFWVKPGRLWKSRRKVCCAY